MSNESNTPTPQTRAEELEQVHIKYPEFRDFFNQVPAGIPGVEVGGMCMSYLMYAQYGKHPPNPCPCY